MSPESIRKTVALVLVSAAAAKAAAAPVDITSITSTNNILYVSGSTSLDPALMSYLVNDPSSPCDPTATSTPPALYVGMKAGAEFTAVACIGSAAAGAGAGSPIAIIKEDNGGSQHGIDALNGSGTTRTFPALSAGNCGSVLVAAPAVNTCTGYSTVATLPALGFTDAEPALFGDSTTSTPTKSVDVVYAAAVSLGLYHELQTSALNCGGCTLGSDTTGDMPNLPPAVLARLFTSGINNWTAVLPAVATTSVTFGNSSGSCWNGSTTMSGCSTPPSATPSSTSVFICQRGQASGTQRVAEAFLSGQNCQSGAASFNTSGVLPSSCQSDGCVWATNLAADKNWAGASTGDLLTCLQGQDQVGHLAIGFAAIDYAWGSLQSNTARRDFRYISYSPNNPPSIERAASGNYNWWSQGSLYQNSAAVTSGSAAQTMLATVVSQFPSVTGVAAANTGSVYQGTPLWDAGILAIPASPTNLPNAATAAIATFEANPVNSLDRSLAVPGSNTNHCVPPELNSLTPSFSATPTWLTP